MKAAIFHGPHKLLTIEDVDIDKPIGREVLVRTVASGVCHSDLHFVDGYYPFPTPAILGHEAAGVVEAVGRQVTEFKPGDRVIACLSVFCGQCDYCLTGKTHLCCAYGSSVAAACGSGGGRHRDGGHAAGERGRWVSNVDYAPRRTPRRNGRTTYTVSCQGPAPSMRAASTCSSGSTWSPARIISMVNGNHSQMSATMMAPSA